MADDSDPTAPASKASTHLGYAIRSARAVVQAPIARNWDAAEEAALRTCRDCDLLIHLLRDLVSVLRDPCNEQLGLSPWETLILARRAEQFWRLWMSRKRTANRSPSRLRSKVQWPARNSCTSGPSRGGLG